MTVPADTRQLVEQVGWIATGFTVPDQHDVAVLLGRDPADPELVAAWRACGLPEPEDAPLW